MCPVPPTLIRMLLVNLGPLGLSVERLAVLFAFLAALVVGWLVGRCRHAPHRA